MGFPFSLTFVSSSETGFPQKVHLISGSSIRMAYENINTHLIRAMLQATAVRNAQATWFSYF
jgi:hypothetical protein